MSLRLSGWTRLWAVVTIVVWLAGLSWTIVETGFPPLSATAREACGWSGIATAPNNFDEIQSRCLADPAIQSEARTHYFSDKWQLFGILAAFWLVLAMVAGLVAVFISWLGRKVSRSTTS